MFEWNDRYSVGIGSIDAQHQNLFRLAGELHAAMTTGQGKAAAGKVLDRLIQYTATHFAHEERLMRLHDYPGLATHKAQHDALTRQVLQFQLDFQSGRAAITVQLLQFLKSWLEQHIAGSDQQYAPYLKDRAVT
jgi:hemerythrin-like metal-binding protein